MNAVRTTVIKLPRQRDILKERSYKGITIRILKIRLSGLTFGIRNCIIATECMDYKSFHLVRLMGKTKVLFAKRTTFDTDYEYLMSE
jgi:hypothetical protein